jgi:hypothetical protein
MKEKEVTSKGKKTFNKIRDKQMMETKTKRGKIYEDTGIYENKDR